ncbi:hypothetical protein DKX38_016480 [Salix brachista]|uniref:Uncharacterized protein n=1 Tax=Salix brachista TaxID=2182728 RepID=A0A5N5L842_9ROSI|nr:hypothetical protein DKX38_016480 [Salix brachista]
MHLWPTMRIRDSFKSAYLKKLEWNLHRMNNEKKQRSQETSDSNQQRLLDDGDDNRTNQHQPAKTYKAVLIFCREILMLVTCCYCCFCCGDDDMNNFITRLLHDCLIAFLPVASTRTRNDAVSEGIKGSLEIIFQKVEQGLCSFLTSVLMTSQIARVLLSSILNRKMM